MTHPIGWQKKKLIDFCPLQRGFDLPNSKIMNGEYPIVYSNGVKAYHNEYKCKGVGVVTGRSGTIGKVTYIEKNYWPHNTSLWVTDFKGNYPKFVFYLLNYIDLSKYDAGTSVPTLNRNDVHKIIVLVPPLDEQKRIAEILSICDDYIENLSKLIEKKEQYKKGVMQKVLSGKVRFKGFKDEWINYNFKDIFTRITGKKYQINQDKYCQVGKYPVIDQGKKYIIAYSNDENKLLKNNSIIVFGDHTRIFKYINFDFIVGADGVQLLKTNNKFNTKFMYYNLSNQYIPNTGYNRHFKFILEMRFYVPTSIEEQNKIASLLNAIDEDIDNLKKELEIRKQQKKGLMQKLLTGAVRV